eukprot:SAG22_NODE_225_length_14728_cov_58.742361_5_plen_170_part_00
MPFRAVLLDQEAATSEVAALKAKLEEEQQRLVDGGANAEKLAAQIADAERIFKEETEKAARLKQELDEKQAEIAARKAEVTEALASIQPAIDQAQEAVKKIQKNHLEEMKSMLKPPVRPRDRSIRMPHLNPARSLSHLWRASESTLAWLLACLVARSLALSRARRSGCG